MATKNPAPLTVCRACEDGEHQHCDHGVQILPDTLGEESPGTWHCTCGSRGHSLDSFPRRKS